MKKLFIVLVLLAIGATTVSAKKIRVMSYNVHNCIGSDGIKSYKRCAEIILDAKPDIVAIQEVDSMASRRNNCYVLGEMAKHCGYYPYYGKTIPFQGGAYGIGVLTKEKALSVEFYRLPCRREPRGLLVVEMKDYYLLATHLSLVKEDQLSSVEIIREVASKLNKPVFIAGDLNARPDSKTMTAFKEFATILNDTSKATFSAKKPHLCIDYIMGTNGSFKSLNNHVYYGSLASDHLPLYVDVRYKKAKKSKK